MHQQQQHPQHSRIMHSIFIIATCCLLLLDNVCAQQVLGANNDNSNLNHAATSSRLRASNNGPRIVILPSEPVFFIDSHNSANKGLTCQTAGDKPEMFSQIRWTGPNRLDNWDELAKRHSVQEEIKNSNVWDLQFRNPTVDDSGEYFCFAQYQSSDSFNASIRVKVHSPIRLDNCPERQFLVQGSTNNKITCRITADSPRITLWKDNVTVDQYENRYKWDNEDGLVINGQVNASDAGLYTVRVRAELTGERRTQHIRVEVHSRPEIAPYNGPENQSEFRGVEGEMTQLECKVSGNPRPLVYWYDPRMRNLTSVGGYIVNLERGTLIIQKVNKVDDNGPFQCDAINNVGTVSRKVSMAVQIRPQIVAFENKTVDEDSEVEFECRSSGEPAPDFSIRKHGENEQPYRVGDGLVRDINTRAEGGGSNVYVHRLRILAHRSHHGIHYCNATNQAGSAERIGNLFVNFKPDLNKTPPEQFVKLGKRTAITCHIRAYPEPVVSWYIDGTQIINVDSNMITAPDRQTHIVTMEPPSIQQTAFSKIICRASNKMGYAEQMIIPRYTTAPGTVVATLVERGPTTVKLSLSVPNEGGDRIKAFKYSLDGRTLDNHNPMYRYRFDQQNETIIDASLNLSSVYTIRNLLPFYTYRMKIRATNDVGDGDYTETHFDTTKPTRPSPPIIVRPSLSYSEQSGIASEYSNGYVLRWSPPELDNGEPVTRYIVKYHKLTPGSLDMIAADSDHLAIVEQMSERPMYARLGPLESNRRYRVQIQARNAIDDSDPASLTIYTTSDRPTMPEFDVKTLAWFIAPSTPILLVILVVAVTLLIFIDIIFCVCFHIGVTYFIKSWCYPSKSDSVISDKTYT